MDSKGHEVEVEVEVEVGSCGGTPVVEVFAILVERLLRELPSIVDASVIAVGSVLALRLAESSIFIKELRSALELMGGEVLTGEDVMLGASEG
jgi:hypothetical protein